MKAHLIRISAVLLIIVFAVQAQFNSKQKIEALAQKSGCFKCHGAVDDKNKIIGPSFQDMANKYKKDSVSIGMSQEVLIERVKKGSKGYWTEVSRGVPMPPYSGHLSDVEIRSGKIFSKYSYELSIKRVSS